MRVGIGVGISFPLDQVEAGGGSDLVVVVVVSRRLVVVLVIWMAISDL